MMFVEGRLVGKHSWVEANDGEIVQVEAVVFPENGIEPYVRGYKVEHGWGSTKFRCLAQHNIVRVVK